MGLWGAFYILEIMSFERLLKNLEYPLKKLVRELHRGGSWFDEEDLYQETVVYLWEEYRKGNLSGKTYSFIFRRAYFFIKNFLRKEFRKLDILSVSLEQIEENGEFLAQPSGEFVPGEMALLLEEIETLFNREEIEIFHLLSRGLTVREISAIKGITHPAVVKKVNKIRQKISPFLEELFV